MYSPKLKPLGSELKKKIKTTNWDKVTPMLIGFDVYVDVDGNVGFYEGNSIPHAIDDYRVMYGSHLDHEIGKVLSNKGVIGINVDPSLDSMQMAQGYEHATNICEENGLDFVSGSRHTLFWDNKRDKFYFDKPTGREYFDFLFNRHVKANPELREKVPVNKWAIAPILNPIWHSYILGSKARTTKALTKFGLESPLAFVVRSDDEVRAATSKILQHIKQNHPNYQAPFILVKPTGAAGGKGIHVFNSGTDVLDAGLAYPYLVGERINASPRIEHDQKHMIDMRIFYCNGKASKAIGCVAPSPFINEQGVLDTRTINTNLCSGGHTTRVSPDVEKLLGEYVLAAALAINERAKEVPEEVK